jgi:hypothetical protein
LIEIMRVDDVTTKEIMIKHHNKLKYNRELLGKIASLTNNTNLALFLD